jgi:hypothetical protein
MNPLMRLLIVPGAIAFFMICISYVVPNRFFGSRWAAVFTPFASAFAWELYVRAVFEKRKATDLFSIR